MDKRMDSMGIFDYVETQEGTYEYTSKEIREQFAGMVGNGVLKGIGDQFNASAAGLQVTIGTGEGWLLGAHGKTIGSFVVTLDPVASGMAKICSIVMDLDVPNQQLGFSVLAGTQAASPSAPQITQTETRYQQLLWQARVHDDGTITLTDCRTLIIRPGDGTTPESLGAAKKSVLATAVLNRNNWSNNAYTLNGSAVAALSAVTAQTTWELLPDLSATDAQIEALQSANLLDGGQAVGSITIRAKNGAPTIDVPVRIIIRGDLY